MLSRSRSSDGLFLFWSGADYLRPGMCQLPFVPTARHRRALKRGRKSAKWPKGPSSKKPRSAYSRGRRWRRVTRLVEKLTWISSTRSPRASRQHPPALQDRPRGSFRRRRFRGCSEAAQTVLRARKRGSLRGLRSASDQGSDIRRNPQTSLGPKAHLQATAGRAREVGDWLLLRADRPVGRSAPRCRRGRRNGAQRLVERAAVRAAGGGPGRPARSAHDGGGPGTARARPPTDSALLPRGPEPERRGPEAALRSVMGLP